MSLSGSECGDGTHRSGSQWLGGRGSTSDVWGIWIGETGWTSFCNIYIYILYIYIYKYIYIKRVTPKHINSLDKKRRFTFLSFWGWLYVNLDFQMRGLRHCLYPMNLIALVSATTNQPCWLWTERIGVMSAACCTSQTIVAWSFQHVLIMVSPNARVICFVHLPQAIPWLTEFCRSTLHFDWPWDEWGG